MRFTLDGGVPLVEHPRLTGEGDPASYAAGWQRHLDLLAAHLTGSRVRPTSPGDGRDDLSER